MTSEQMIRKSFEKAKEDINSVRYETLNNIRYLNIKLKEYEIRIREMERRLAQSERLMLRENMG
jgi:hypothetical protein